MSGEQERDDVLDILEVTRADLIGQATELAIQLAKTDGATCSPRVLKVMKARGVDLSTFDPRWAGAVFRPGKGWALTGEYVREGSHGRPVPLWRRA